MYELSAVDFGCTLYNVQPLCCYLSCNRAKNAKYSYQILCYTLPPLNTVLGVHPQNVRFQNVRFQNVRLQNVWNVRFTKRQIYKTSGLQNVRFTKCQVYKTSGLQNVWLQKNIHIYSVLVVGGNPQVLLQPCLQAKWFLNFVLYFRGFFAIYHHNRY